MAKAKRTFWRDFGIGLFSSIVAGTIVSVIITKYVNVQTQILQAEVEMLRRQVNM